MAFNFSDKKPIQEVLTEEGNSLCKYIPLLAKEYEVLTGRVLNTGCAACIREAVLLLRNKYGICNFRFKRTNPYYKDKPEDKTTISNSTLTDAKAIAFLRTRPERIELFSVYPSNWEELIKGNSESDKERERRVAIEAERDALKESLVTLSLKELRVKYPEIKDRSKIGFIEKVLCI